MELSDAHAGYGGVGAVPEHERFGLYPVLCCAHLHLQRREGYSGYLEGQGEKVCVEDGGRVCLTKELKQKATCQKQLLAYLGHVPHKLP